MVGRTWLRCCVGWVKNGEFWHLSGCGDECGGPDGDGAVAGECAVAARGGVVMGDAVSGVWGEENAADRDERLGDV